MSPLNLPCLNSPPCRGYTDHLGGLCPSCQKLADECPRCGRSRSVLDVTIQGVPYRVSKITRTKKRYITVGDDEVLYCLPLPLIVVEKG